MVRCKNVAGSSQPPLEIADIAIFENEHGWEKFAKHPDEKELKKKSINVTLVKEFYAHFTDPNQGTVYVRSERVEFTAKAINKFFAVKRTADLHTPFMNSMKDQNIDFMLENLCFQGAEWDEAKNNGGKRSIEAHCETLDALLEDKPAVHYPYCHRISRKQSPLLFPRLIAALCRQKGVMEDETDFYIKGRQGIKPTQIPNLMGFDEDATAKAPLGGARTIAAARLAELMALTEKMQEAPQEQATPQPPPAKKNVASTSTATPQTRPPALEEQAGPAIPPAHAPASTPRPSAKNTTATRRTLTKKDKGKAPVKPTPCTPAPEATVKLDNDDDNDKDMPDVPQPPAPTVDTSIPRHRLKRKANRKISTADLATEENDVSDAEEDDGSSTTPEETAMTSPP
ncbi:hypothetical protein V6N11_073716 [Hibiscus sabdariffa]|uniref:Putative plant transposon protein domain-containing protein n=1 Tax=Hibiscus sabdariffa TaxID=183260 RepID=A0ABR2AEN1_9ROSI